LYALIEAHRKEGKTEISDEEKETVPPTFLGELISALDEMRRLARIYSVITSAEAIVQLFLDMTRAARTALDEPAQINEIIWFVLNRMIEDRMAEFVHGYREDLGLGAPRGAPKAWPDQQRTYPMSMTREEAEAFVRTHLQLQTNSCREEKAQEVKPDDSDP